VNAFPAHPFPPRGSGVLRPFDYADLPAIGLRLPHPYVADVLDDAAWDACAMASAAISGRLPSMQEDLARAAAAVNRCSARCGLGRCPEWRWTEGMSDLGIYRWMTLPAAWGTDLLADHLTPMMQGDGSRSPAGKAINRLAELRDAILAGRNWWPAWDRALKSLAAVPVIWAVPIFPEASAPPSAPPPRLQPRPSIEVMA
jgi:hypothetical protein